MTSDESQAAATGQHYHGMHNYDFVPLDIFNVNVVYVTGLSAKVIPGATPTACPDANPAMPPSMLSAALDAVRRANALPAGTTIHWVGHDAGMRNRCRCHPDAPFAAPFDAHRWSSCMTNKSAASRTKRDPDRPSEDRQSDILAAIRTAGTPLMRDEIAGGMKLPSPGKLGNNLAWMVREGILVNIASRGYWPAGETYPN